MSIQDFGTIEANASLKQVIDALAHLQDTLNFLLNGQLDVENIRANSINADRIKAHTITADRMDVQELSAITANLGHITAGLIEAVEIYGSYIATSTGYPRIEFTSAAKLLQAFLDATHYIFISPDEVNAPTLVFKNPTGQTNMFMNPDDSGNFSVNTTSGRMTLSSSVGDVRLSPGGNLQIGNLNGYNNYFDVITGVNFTSQTTTSKRVTVTKGIITSVV